MSYSQTARPLAAAPSLDRLLGARGLVLLVLAIAAALRLHNIGTDGFWKNELFSLVWIRQPVSFLLGEGLWRETNPPLHFLILKGWTALFGSSETAARLPSTLASLAAVALTWRLGATLGRPRVGLLAAALLAISPVQILFAHEARAYALLPAFAALAMVGAAGLLRTDTTRAPPRIGDALYICVGLAGLLHTHATGVFAAAALGFVTLVGVLATPAPRAALRLLLPASVLAGLSASPVLLAMLTQSGSDNIGWMPKLGLDTPIVLSRFLLIGPMVRTDYGDAAAHIELLGEMLLGSVTALTLIVMARLSLRDLPSRLLLIDAPLLFVVLLAATSLVRPVLIPRVTLFLSVPICLCAAAIVTGPLPRLARTVAAVLFGACLAVGLWNNVIAPAQHKPDWRALLAEFPITPDGPTIVAGPHAGPLGLAFYSDQPLARPPRHWVADAALNLTNADRQERQVSGALPIDTAGLAALIAEGRGVVLYLDDDDEVLIGRHLEGQAWFARASRRDLPGLVVLRW